MSSIKSSGDRGILGWGGNFTNVNGGRGSSKIWLDVGSTAFAWLKGTPRTRADALYPVKAPNPNFISLAFVIIGPEARRTSIFV